MIITSLNFLGSCTRMCTRPFTSYQVSSLDKKSFHYAVCLLKGIGCEKNEEKLAELKDIIKKIK